MNIVKRLITKAAISFAGTSMYRWMNEQYGVSLPQWIEDNLEAYLREGYAGNADIFSIIGFIHDMGASVPWKLQRQKKDGTWEDVQKHEVLDRWRNPNPKQTRNDYVKSWLGFYASTGNAYQFGIPLESGLNAGKFQELHIMKSHLIEPKVDEKTGDILGYKLTYDPNNLINPEWVCHAKTWNPFSEDKGLSPMQPGSKNITLSNLATQTNVRSYHNMGPGGIVSKEGTSGEYTAEQGIDLQNKIDQRYTGADNAKKIIYTGASVKFTLMGLSPVDLGILSQTKLNMAQLCNLWHLAVQLFNNTEASTYNNMNEAYKAAYLNCILPMLGTLAEDLNSWYVPKFAKEGEVLQLIPDTSGISVLQEDKKELAEWLDKAWYLTPNEKRSRLGFGELKKPEMDEIYIPSNLIPIGQEQVTPEEQSAAKWLKEQGISDYSSNGKY